MSSHELRHPDNLDLLRLLDGELPPREARVVRQHLESCWQCRTEADELTKTIGECVRYRKNVLQLHLPSPPAPWMDIHAAFSRYDTSPGRVSFFQKCKEALAQGNRWLIPAAVAAGLVCAIYLNLHETPAVQAAALLHQAVVAEQSAPPAPRQVRIETRKHKLVRTTGRVSARKANAGEAEVAAMFQAARYDWDDPLSARAFQQWRAQLPEKKDKVEEVSSRGVDGWMVRTSTSSGELASASLTLRRIDFHPTDGRLEFRNQEWVEMTEIPVAPDVSASSESVPGAATGLPRRSPNARVPAAEPPAEPHATASEELQVVAALHRLGADLGDPVEVGRDQRNIVVSGIGIEPDRQEQIRSALKSMPNVVVQFSEPADVPGGGAPVSRTIESPAGGEALRFQQRLEAQLGGRSQFEQFTSQVLDLNEAMMARAYALRRLSQRFRPDAELTVADKATLSHLGQDHADALLAATKSLQQVLNPLLTALGGTAGAVQQSKGERAWQPATEDLFQAAHRVETLAAAMLDVSPRNTNPALPSQMLTALAQLRASTEQYAQLVGEIR